MTSPLQNRNTAHPPAVLAAEIEGVLFDAASSSLPAEAAAILVALPKLKNVACDQVITASISLLREQAKLHAEIVAQLEEEIAGDHPELNALARQGHKS